MSNAEFNEEQFKRELDEAVAPYRADAERWRKARSSNLVDIRIVGVGKRSGVELDKAIDEMYSPETTR